MNREEALLLTGRQTPADAVAAIAEMGPELIAITAGGDGAYVYGEGALNFVEPRRVEVAYDIGAGDTFHAGLVAAYLAGLSPEQSGRIAADAAALRISRCADMASLPTWEEVQELSQQPL
jgi:sugar/nucleoside kinase (ribokinase family)